MPKEATHVQTKNQNPSPRQWRRHGALVTALFAIALTATTAWAQGAGPEIPDTLCRRHGAVRQAGVPDHEQCVL